jgi:hypothetical protein
MTQAPSSGGPTLCPSCGNANYLSTGSCWKCGHRFEPEVAPPSITPEPVAADPSPGPTLPALAPTPTFSLAPPGPVVIEEEPAPPEEPEEPHPAVSEEPPRFPVEPEPQQEIPPFVTPLPRSEPRDRRPYLAPSKPVPHRTGAVSAPPTVRVCPRCAAILHAHAYHCWKCGADTPLYTRDVRQREEWAEQEQLLRARNAALITKLEGDQNTDMTEPSALIEINSDLIKGLSVALGVVVLVHIVNPVFRSWFSDLPVPFSFFEGLWHQISDLAGFLIVPLLIATSAVIISQITHKKVDQ